MKTNKTGVTSAEVLNIVEALADVTIDEVGEQVSDPVMTKLVALHTLVHCWLQLSDLDWEPCDGGDDHHKLGFSLAVAKVHELMKEAALGSD